MTSKRQAIAAILDAAGSTPVVCTTGYTSRIAQSLGHRPHNLYMTGSMGLAAAIGAGIASATNRRRDAREVVALGGNYRSGRLCSILDACMA